ncbi:unnamed protein product, partial [marine sediment metagenome]
IVLGLHLSGVITIPFLEQERRLNLKTGEKVGCARSFVVGSSFSAGWSPCIGPTLGAVLALSAASASVWQGVINYASGALLIIVSILIFTNSLINLNSLFNFGFLGDLSAEA